MAEKHERPHFPRGTPASYVRLAQRCWAPDPAARYATLPLSPQAMRAHQVSCTGLGLCSALPVRLTAGDAATTCAWDTARPQAFALGIGKHSRTGLCGVCGWGSEVLLSLLVCQLKSLPAEVTVSSCLPAQHRLLLAWHPCRPSFKEAVSALTELLSRCSAGLEDPQVCDCVSHSAWRAARVL